MPNSPSYLDINLVKKRVSFTDKFLRWALSAGRVVVILTEVVALSAFVYRFFLDRQLIDLHAKIRQEQAIIAFSKTSEDKYRNLQDRIGVVNQFSNLSAYELKILKDTLALFPSGTTFNNLTTSDTSIKINASFTRISQLGAFVDSLKNYPSIASVSIEKIENIPSSSLISVSITGTLKPIKKSDANTKQ
ncbi:MAG: hypothetical protein HYU48_02095 [Candidatus Levybacteria bacterium]|nr:hypothetical protein [Candidatus Levybacteria bacterium]